MMILGFAMVIMAFVLLMNYGDPYARPLDLTEKFAAGLFLCGGAIGVISFVAWLWRVLL